VLISVCQLCAYLAAVIWSTSTDSLDSSSGSGKSWKTSFANALTPSAVAFTPVAPLETDGFENSCADRRSLFGPGGGRLFAHQVNYFRHTQLSLLALILFLCISISLLSSFSLFLHFSFESSYCSTLTCSSLYFTFSTVRSRRPLASRCQLGSAAHLRVNHPPALPLPSAGLRRRGVRWRHYCGDMALQSLGTRAWLGWLLWGRVRDSRAARCRFAPLPQRRLA